MAANETGAQPTKAQQIADGLKAAIERGDYGPGDRLPGEKALAEQHDVAGLTARAALKILRTEGLIDMRKGASPRVMSFDHDATASNDWPVTSGEAEKNDLVRRRTAAGR